MDSSSPLFPPLFQNFNPDYPPTFNFSGSFPPNFNLTPHLEIKIEEGEASAPAVLPIQQAETANMTQAQLDAAGYQIIDLEEEESNYQPKLYGPGPYEGYSMVTPEPPNDDNDDSNSDWRFYKHPPPTPYPGPCYDFDSDGNPDIHPSTSWMDSGVCTETGSSPASSIRSKRGKKKLTLPISDTPNYSMFWRHRQAKIVDGFILRSVFDRKDHCTVIYLRQVHGGTGLKGPVKGPYFKVSDSFLV